MRLDFFTVLDQVLVRLCSRGRVTYKALKLQFNLDDTHLAVLKEELLYTYPEVVDDAGRGLSRAESLPHVVETASRYAEPTDATGATARTPSEVVPVLPAAPVRPALEAERRQLTVLFCLQGEPIHRLPSNAICKRGIARTFQMVRPFLNLTTLRNVVMAASFGRTSTPSRHEAEAIAWHWLEFIGLADKAHVLARSLPFGARKRLEMARALATRPQLLLLDEAIAGLNPTEVSQIMLLIRAVQRTGVTIFLIEHVMKAVLGLSDKVIVLNHGETIAEGPPQEVANDPQVIEAYLGQKRPT